VGASHRKLLPVLPLLPLQGVYVYCVVQRATKPRVMTREGRLPGAGAPRALPLGPRTWLIVADVPLDIYGEQALAGRLKDLDWLSACGVAHQAILDACLTSDAVVPMKLFTIFASDARAVEEMTRQIDRLSELMLRVAGCAEWGVRVTRATQPAPAQAAPAGVTPASAQPAGRAFLEAKAHQRRAARDAAESLDQDLRALAATLHDVTRDVRYRADASGIGAPLLLDAAYLVTRTTESRFRAQVRAKARPLLERGCRVTVTGPWPPYSFVSRAPDQNQDQDQDARS